MCVFVCRCSISKDRNITSCIACHCARYHHVPHVCVPHDILIVRRSSRDTLCFTVLYWHAVQRPARLSHFSATSAVSTRPRVGIPSRSPCAGLIPVCSVTTTQAFAVVHNSKHAKIPTYISFSDPRPKVTLSEPTEDRSVL